MARVILPLTSVALLLGMVAVACGTDAVPAAPELDAGPTAQDGGPAVLDAGAPDDPDDAESPDSPIPTFAVGGIVNGLAGTGLVLQNNAGDDITVAASATFVFATKLEAGKPFAVTVKTQPTSPPQTCVITGGTGTVASADVSTVTVDCTTDAFTVGGNVTGLAAGNEVVLQNNGGDDVTVSADDSFIFATPVKSGESFAVSVLTQPSAPNQTCVVTGGTGTVAAGNVVSIAVNCTTERYTAGGTVSGLDGVGLVLQNGGSDVPINANGTFSMPPQADGSTYDITVKTQPTAQRCTVTNGAGTLQGANVTDVTVACVDLFTIGGTVTGLAAGSVVLTNNGGDDLTVSANGTFTFATPVSADATYAVAIKTQPTDRECQIVNASGTPTVNVTNVTVTCGHTRCRTVGGQLWCRDVVGARSCNTFCSATGLSPPTIDDATWFAAQNEAHECSALAAAFGVGSTNLGAWSISCAEIHGNSMACSTNPSCPTAFRLTPTIAPSVYAVCPCGDATACATGNEGAATTVTCPAGSVITSIAYASYGLPTGSCGSFTNGTCHSATSQLMVEQRCLGKTTCTVNATNEVFGDPCFGAGKRLYIQASCQ